MGQDRREEMMGSQEDSSALLPTEALGTEAGCGGEQKACSTEEKALGIPLSVSVQDATTQCYMDWMAY